MVRIRDAIYITCSCGGGCGWEISFKILVDLQKHVSYAALYCVFAVGSGWIGVIRFVVHYLVSSVTSRMECGKRELC